MKRIVASVDAILQDAPNEELFTEKELDNAIKSLRKLKCPEPDNIPSEIFLKATGNTRIMYLKMLNHILEKGSIPEQWLSGNITRLYKGKGTKGKCSNEGGITLASNVGKLFERMVNNRATATAQMTDAQAGGKKAEPLSTTSLPTNSSQLDQNTKNACLRHLSTCNQGPRWILDRRHTICHVQKGSKLKTLENH